MVPLLKNFWISSRPIAASALRPIESGSITPLREARRAAVSVVSGGIGGEMIVPTPNRRTLPQGLVPRVDHLDAVGREEVASAPRPLQEGVEEPGRSALVPGSGAQTVESEAPRPSSPSIRRGVGSFNFEDTGEAGQEGVTLTFRASNSSPVAMQGGGHLDLDQMPSRVLAAARRRDRRRGLGSSDWVLPGDVDEIERRFVTPLSTLLTLATDTACPPVAVEVAIGPTKPLGDARTFPRPARRL